MKISTYLKQRAQLILCSLVSLSCLVVTTGCPDEVNGPRQASSAAISLSPASFQFAAAPVGSPAQTREVEVSNNGSLTLLMTNFSVDFNNPSSYTLDYRKSARPDQTIVGIDQEQGNLLSGALLEVEPGESITFILTYVPDEVGAGQSLNFDCNDPDNLSVSIPIDGGSINSELFITPNPVDFGRVAAGEHGERVITVTNVGTSAANIDSVTLGGSMDFSVTLNGDDPTQNSNLLGDPEGDNSPGLSALSSFEMVVSYDPLMEGPDEGVLTLIQANGNQINVRLTANGASPCINLVFPDSGNPNADELNFVSLIDQTRSQTVKVESCGGEPLSISGIRVEGEHFSLGGNVPSSYPVLLPPITDGTIATNQFLVEFTPPEIDLYEGTLIIESNDPISPVLEVPLTGRGSINACPEAAVAEPMLNVQPLDIVTLDASPSVDADGPGGLPVSYEWVITQRPLGSTAQPVERFANPLRPADGGPADDRTTPTALFFVDIAGEYTAELVVTDEQGFSAPSSDCPQAVASVYINASPDGAVLVELTWHTPSDPDETDRDGTDVDLHLLNFEGGGWTSTNDCYYNNTNPLWGASLDIDDTNGAGPENITIDNPENTNGNYYRVGVHYFSSGDEFFGVDYGPSDATIRVYLLGQLAGEWTQRLMRTGNFWEVAGIEWSPMSSRVVEINRLYDYTP